MPRRRTKLHFSHKSNSFKYQLGDQCFLLNSPMKSSLGNYVKVKQGKVKAH